jgi:signal transduction histidine kinase
MNFPKFLFLFLLLSFISCKNEELKSTELDFNLEKAELFNASKQYNKAYAYYNNSLEHNKKIQNNKRVVYCLLMMANIESTECDFVKSETTTTKAISLFDKNIDDSYRAAALNLLGLNYTALNNFDEALKVYENVFAITDDELTKTITKNNIAYVYSKKREFKKAISILTEIENNKHILDSLQDYATRENYARVLHNKGFYLFHLKDKMALEYMLKALELREKDKDDSQIVSSYMHLAQFYLDKDKNEAYKWAEKAYISASKANIPDDRLEALNLLFKSSDNNNLKDEHYDNYIQLNDSLIKARQQAKNQFAKIKYDASKSEAQSKILNEQKEKLIISIVAIVLLALISFILIRIKNKQKQLKTIYDTETRISKQLHDELANDVFNTLIFIENQDISVSENKEKIVHEIDKIYKRTRSISHENSSIDVGIEYPKEFRSLLNNFITSEIHVVTKGIDEVNWSKILPIKKISIYRVLQELMVNMKKHSKCSLVFVAISSNKGTLEIKYSDNGIGLQEEKFKIGLQNVENRIKSINGTITFESNNGLKVKINIPI